MKVIIISPQYHPTIGPCTNRIEVLKKTLENNGFKSCVVTFINKDDKCDTANKDVLQFPTKKRSNNFVIRVLQEFKQGFNMVRLTKKLVDDDDILITTSPPLILSYFSYRLAKKMKVKLIFDVRDIWPDIAVEIGAIKQGGIIWRLYSYLSENIYNYASYITTVSDGKVSKLSKKHPRVLKIENGIDEDMFKNNKFVDSSNFSIMNNNINVVYTGNVGNAQNIELLIELADYIRDRVEFKFHIYGFGNKVEDIMKLVNTKNLTNVHFHTPVSKENFINVLSNAQITFASLINENLTDSIPTKLFEYICFGGPVFFVGKGESSKLINGSGYGLAVEDNCLQVVIKSFEYYLSSHTDFLKNRDGAIKYVRDNYSRQKAMLKILPIVEELKDENTCN